MEKIATKTRQTLANNIVYYRTKNNLSQEQLAELLGTTPSYISDIENEKRNISCDYLDKIANIFNIESYKLLVNRPPVSIRRIPKSKR